MYRMTFVERVATFVATGSVALLGTIGAYALHGPLGDQPVVLTVPDSVLAKVCPDAYGCYWTTFPDFIVLSETGSKNAATLPHEMLHYAHPSWNECTVSAYLFTTTGLRDGYKTNGSC